MAHGFSTFIFTFVFLFFSSTRTGESFIFILCFLAIIYWLSIIHRHITLPANAIHVKRLSLQNDINQ